MKKIFSIIIFLNLFCTNISHAESTGYEVEIIIFSYLNDKYEISENWPKTEIITTHDTNQPQQEVILVEKKNTPEDVLIDSTTTEEKLITDNTLDIIDEPVEKPIDLHKEAEFLSPEHYRLTREADRIKKNPNYNFLIHIAWKQAGLPKDEAFPVYLNRMESTLALESSEILNQQNPTASLLDSNDSIKTHLLTAYLEGEIKLVMSRYLHISSKLILHKFNPINIENSMLIEKKEIVYKINLDRRMRSKEINFIDHPLVGLLVIATPFIIPDHETDEQVTTPIYKTIN